MPSGNALTDLLTATRQALSTARLSFGAPVAEIDQALAGMGSTQPGKASPGDPPDVVTRYLTPGAVKHPQANTLLERLVAAANELPWLGSFYPEDGYPDISRFRDGYAFSMVISDPLYADNTLMTSKQVSLNYTIQAPDTVYPEHAHTAVELYYVIAGKALWKRGTEPWVERYPGDIILHTTGMRHAMKTVDEPLIAAALWVSHTDAPVVIVRR